MRATGPRKASSSRGPGAPVRGAHMVRTRRAHRVATCLALVVCASVAGSATWTAGTAQAAPNACVVYSLGSFVAQGESTTAAEVADIVEVKCDPFVYGTGSKIKITADQLFSRCKGDLSWYATNPFAVTAGRGVTVELDADGNATVALLGGPGCSAGESLITAHLEEEPFESFTTAFTVLSPNDTPAGVVADARGRCRHDRRGGVRQRLGEEGPHRLRRALRPLPHQPASAMGADGPRNPSGRRSPGRGTRQQRQRIRDRDPRPIVCRRGFADRSRPGIEALHDVHDGLRLSCRYNRSGNPRSRSKSFRKSGGAAADSRKHRSRARSEKRSTTRSSSGTPAIFQRRSPNSLMENATRARSTEVQARVRSNRANRRPTPVTTC